MVQNYYEGFEISNPLRRDPSGNPTIDPSGIPIEPIEPTDPSGNPRKIEGDKSILKFAIGSVGSLLGLGIGLAMAALLVYWSQTPELYGTHPAPPIDWEYSVYNVFMRIWQQIKYYTVGSLNEWTAKYKEHLVQDNQETTDTKYAWLGTFMMVIYPLVMGLLYGVSPVLISVIMTFGIILAYIMNTAHHIDTANVLRFFAIRNVVRMFILFIGMLLLFGFFIPIMGVSYISIIVLLLYISITSLFKKEYKDILKDIFNNSKKIMLLLSLAWIAYYAKYLNGYELPAGIVTLSVGRYIQGVLGSLIVVLVFIMIYARLPLGESIDYSNTDISNKSYTYGFIASIIIGTLYSVGTQYGE
jgi:hypothetical protein